MNAIDDDSTREERLQFYLTFTRKIFRDSKIGGLAVGNPRADAELLELGRNVLAELPPAKSGNIFDGPDVYLATEIPTVGGHGLLIGDFVCALGIGNAGRRLILTNAKQKQHAPVPIWSLQNLGFDPDQIEILEQTTLTDKLKHLLLRLQELRPGRLFLFQHPNDPIAVAAAQTSLAGRRFLIHHSDHQPTFGLYLPDTQIVELHPSGSALSRLLGIAHEMLPLTSPDPGPRLRGFRQHATLTTLSSGRSQKFEHSYRYNYPETVGHILKATGGRHVHLGPLGDETLQAIAQILEANTIDSHCFIHRPWVPSLAEALWEFDCDVYVSSFPEGGGRTNTEVLATGTPLLLHQTFGRISVDPVRPPGHLLWTNWEDLKAVLAQCEDRDFLEKSSQSLRQYYEENYHPSVFRERLLRILEGKGGAVDPDSSVRDLSRARAVVQSLVGEAFDHQTTLYEQAMKLKVLNEKQRTQNKKLRDLQERLKKLETIRQTLQKGSSWRARLLRWLSKT